MSGRVAIWKHDCIRHGMGSWLDDSVRECEPRCSEPWQVDVEWPQRGAVFATWVEAMAYVNSGPTP